MPTIETSGGRAGYELVGEGPPLLMFSGGPGLSTRFVRADAEIFAERFACYMVDAPGTGDSSPPASPADYDHLSHARFYDEVRSALGLDQVSVFGWSFGGTVALSYAARFPDRVDRCIAVRAFGFGTDVDAGEKGEAAAEMERALARHENAPWYPQARSAMDRWTRDVLSANDGAEVVAMLRAVLPLYFAYPERPEIRPRIEALIEGLTIDLRAAKAWEGGLYQSTDIRPLVGKIKAPTLLLAGALDLIGGPAQARPLADAIPGADLEVMTGCGHMPSLEDPGIYRSLVFAWLDRS